MDRASFLHLLALGPITLSGRNQDQSDPASTTQSQALRVLLGKGPVQTIDAQTFSFNGRRYRGTFAAMDDGSIITTVPLEQYLYSVVSREMPSSWPPSALQAQAIVARTYVLHRSDPRRAYDLVPSQADQVYTGIDAEHAQSNAAVDSSAGQVLRFADGFAQVLYSSCCGGHTEASSDAWGGAPLQYLSGVACPYCTASPWYKWTQSIPFERVQTALTQQLSALGDIGRLTLDAPDGSGRSRFWTFTGTTGEARLKAADVRRALGTRAVPSLLVRRAQLDASGTQAPRTLVLEGAGLGHGVGLCQWGARGMALTGADAPAILAFYYPGTGIGNG